MQPLDVVIIGAGVVGLAVAREISRNTSCSVAVVEKNRRYGQGVSSRNSEVIHAGIYYPDWMLKSRLCVEGNRLLYRFCEENRIPYRRCGKLIIAVDAAGEEKLEVLWQQGQLNGVRVWRLSRREIREKEPEVFAREALYLPDSGTLDGASFMQVLYWQSREAGAEYVFDSAVQGAEYKGGYYYLQTQKETIAARVVINSAGLGAEEVAGLVGIDTAASGYRLHWCKGEYFSLRRRADIRHLIYPVPTPYSLGIHLSFDREGMLRLGPNAFYIEEIDYTVNEEHAEEFFQAASVYLPWLRRDDLSPDFAGIRPKLQGPGEEMRDFVIRDEKDQGFPGWINLIGIESPGFTSSLAIARLVREMVAEYT